MVNWRRTKFVIFFISIVLCLFSCQQKQEEAKPNILFIISDDQSFIHTSISGSNFINTPAFDKIASEGILFTNAIAASPGCSPSRAAILTGKYPWQIDEAGTHASSFPTKFKVFPDILEDAGYKVGFTGKGWAPGDYEVSGRKRNPAGDEYSKIQLIPPYEFISTNDYSENFKEFYNKKNKNQPFYFWMGFNEPHRDFEKGSWKKEGKNIDDVDVPLFLPDVPEIRKDILDYAVEIEWFDKQVQKTLEFIEEKGELDNTIIVITSDNGMAFPRAKANCFEFGVHVP
ncbi:MAG: sulfatase-like hydrolase/transferase, partial [Draconibacterium sp.]|nr:sulfatase-like hydrolase/transferase [Draconibacterium sp.]